MVFSAFLPVALDAFLGVSKMFARIGRIKSWPGMYNLAPNKLHKIIPYKIIPNLHETMSSKYDPT